MGLYDNILADERQRVATEAAEMTRGRGGVFLAAKGAERMKQGVRSMFGIEEPVVIAQQAAQARQAKLNSIVSKYSTASTRADFTSAFSELMANGFPEEAAKIQEHLKNMPSENTQTGTTYMQNIRDIAKYQLACDFNDPECAKAAQEVWQTQKRAGVEERGDIKYIEEEMKAFSESLTESTKDYQKALYYGNTIDQSLKFLDSGLYTGTGAKTVNKFKQFGMAFGPFFVDPGATATAEMFKVNSMTAIMAWVQKTKGAISEAEMTLFGNASEGLARSVDGNKLILLTAKSLADYQKNLHLERLEWEDTEENPTRRKWLIHKAKWDLKNGNTVPSADEIAKALGSDNVESEVIENDNVVITEVSLGE
jgi:hypothetical protein